MITVICGTHRPQNQTLRVVEKYLEILKELHQEEDVFSMDELPADFLASDSFGKRSEEVERLIDTKITPAERFVIISPEYNGSYPGVLKAFFDGMDHDMWKGKKVALVGVASGRAGNLRGMDHLTDVCHFLRMEVFSLKIPISRWYSLVNDEGEFADDDTIALLREQATEFLKF